MEQKVGVTEFEVNYSRPSVRDRNIFGDLVPYGKLWRTGANKNTLIEFNTTVQMGEQTVEAGEYSLYTIPNEDSWTIILNSATENWGTGGYDEALDVLRTEAPVEGGLPNQESFRISFENLTTSSAHLVFRWADVRVAVPVQVEVEEQVAANIEEALEEAKKEEKWKVYRNAANYYQNVGQSEKALDFMAQSMELNQSSWYSFYLHGEILASLKRHKEAVQMAEQALELGQADAQKKEKEFGYAEMITASIEKWSACKE